MYRRYAVYVTPDAPLAALGAAWLGWDIATGRPVPQPGIDGLDLPAITKRPRKYGFHATVKPPMALVQGTTADAVLRAAQDAALAMRPVTLDGLTVTRIGRFLALTPLGDTRALTRLAAHMVTTLDPFRASATAEELARRRARPLSPAQEENLTRWGYPHVMDEYRFHITLTGALKDAEGTAPLVAAHFAPMLPKPYVISHLTLAGEDAEGMFHTIARLPLRA